MSIPLITPPQDSRIFNLGDDEQNSPPRFFTKLWWLFFNNLAKRAGATMTAAESILGTNTPLTTGYQPLVTVDVDSGVWDVTADVRCLVDTGSQAVIFQILAGSRILAEGQLGFTAAAAISIYNNSSKGCIYTNNGVANAPDLNADGHTVKLTLQAKAAFTPGGSFPQVFGGTTNMTSLRAVQVSS